MKATRKPKHSSGAIGGVFGTVIPIVVDLIVNAYTRKRMAEAERKRKGKIKLTITPDAPEDKKG